MKVQVEKHRQQKQEEEEFIKQQEALWEAEEEERKKQISAREISKFRQRVSLWCGYYITFKVLKKEKK